jgi:replicative DNA helicase
MDALPQNVECEAALIGAMMCVDKLIDPVADRVQAAHFFEPLHGRIFDAIVSLHSSGKRATPVTLCPYFEGDTAMQELGGARNYLAQLTGSGAVVIGATDFADQIRELALRRAFIAQCEKAIEEASSPDPDKSLAGLAVLADDAASAVREAAEEGGEYSASEAIQGVIDQMDKPVIGARCGVIPSIDALLGPLRPTHLVIGAGRPGMGKTATALSYALGAAKRGHGVLFASLEMDAEQLAERMVADLCLERGVPYSAIRDRTLTHDQKREVCRAHAEIADLPLQILDKSGLTLAQLRRLVKRWKRRFEARGQKLEVVIVDYLQLMGGDASNGRFELVSEISRGLKALAKSEGLCVFALSQLSRKVEERADKRPCLADLRESGQIEQDADAVLFFLRMEYYLRQSEPQPNDPSRAKWESSLEGCRGLIEFICAKRRNGSSGTRMGQFHADNQAVRG